MYLRLSQGRVIAILSSDSVRLPMGLILPTSSRDLPLTSLNGPVVVGAGAVRVGGWACRVSQVVSFQVHAGLGLDQRACDRLQNLLAERERGLDLALLDDLPGGAQSPESARSVVRRLLGAGPGLTPAGDDVLAGMLLGLRSFGMPAEQLCSAVLAAVSGGTTELSAALLRCAARGEAVPQVNRLLLALSTHGGRDPVDAALADLVRVGHSSGTALAKGVGMCCSGPPS
jgi:hypothetical protein